MAIPLLSLFIALILLTYTSLFAQNKPIFPIMAKIFAPELKIYFIIGNIFLSGVLILGLIGYFGYIPGHELRIIRLSLGILGILILLNAVKPINKFSAKLWNAVKPINKFIVNNPWISPEKLLTILAASVLTSLFLISFFDATYSGDGFWYHLPFAGRIWGLIPPEVYQFEEILEYRYQGFPLLANFWQGFFWFIFQRPEAANLMCYLSLIIFLLYLRFYLKIPFYLATISLLAVPMVHMHASRMYIDLPSNVFAAIVILTTYMVALKNFEANKYDLLLIFTSAIIAANMKFQMVPIIFMVIVVLVLAWLTKIWLNKRHNFNSKTKIVQSVKLIAICFLASLIIFFTCVKNIVVYQNPFYPMKLEVAGIVFNYAEEEDDSMHSDLKKLPRPIRWGKSLLEIGAFDPRRPWPWSLGMDFIDRQEKTFGLGGYFGGYVVFNLLVVAYISWKFWRKETKYALIFLFPISLFTSYLPQAYMLRYYMYWMLILVSFNAYLCSYFAEKFKTKIIKPLNFGLVATGFMFAFIIATRYWFTIPQFSSFAEQINRTDIIDQELLSQIKNAEHGDDICLIEKTQFAILYSSYFHPGTNHSITAEFEIPEKIERRCQGKKILR